MTNTADIKYIPAKDGAEYTAITTSSVIHGVFEMLTSVDEIGSVDIFGDVMTPAIAADQQRLRRSRAAELLRRVAQELDNA